MTDIIKIATVGLLLITFVHTASEKKDKWWKNALIVLASVASFAAAILLTALWLVPIIVRLIDL